MIQYKSSSSLFLREAIVSSSAMGRNDPALLVPMLSYDSKINAVAMGVDRI